MVNFLTIAFFFLINALTIQAACSYCQCKFASGQNCCVYSSGRFGSQDCATVCAKAHRADGKGNEIGPPGTACGTGAGTQCLTFWNSLNRVPCYVL
ncbi:hypothetical protein NHQ30_004373 [Ciborinia camelliae]|nr:hypothetical protein NHQ30_004373 [Ciborinia camelliae]